MDMTGEPAEALAAEVAARLERLIGLFRWLNPPSGLSLTAAATLATLDRSGPCRLTSLAVREGVTQPAMTQLIARLQGEGLVIRVGESSITLKPDGIAIVAPKIFLN